jgi:hypothetical protein
MKYVTDIENIRKKQYNKPLIIESGKAISVTLGVGRRAMERNGAFYG